MHFTFRLTIQSITGRFIQFQIQQVAAFQLLIKCVKLLLTDDRRKPPACPILKSITFLTSAMRMLRFNDVFQSFGASETQNIMAQFKYL